MIVLAPYSKGANMTEIVKVEAQTAIVERPADAGQNAAIVYVAT